MTQLRKTQEHLEQHTKTEAKTWKYRESGPAEMFGECRGPEKIE